jgi:hypothetical protein
LSRLRVGAKAPGGFHWRNPFVARGSLDREQPDLPHHSLASSGIGSSERGLSDRRKRIAVLVHWGDEPFPYVEKRNIVARLVGQLGVGQILLFQIFQAEVVLTQNAIHVDMPRRDSHVRASSYELDSEVLKGARSMIWSAAQTDDVAIGCSLDVGFNVGGLVDVGIEYDAALLQTYTAVVIAFPEG